MTWGWLGKFKRSIEFPDGSGVAVSPAGRGRMRYNDIAKQFEISEDGGGWSPIGEVGEGGWTDDGTIVRLTTVSDIVGMGSAVQVGSEKVRITGDGTNDGLRIDGNPADPKAYLELAECGNAAISNANEGRLRYDKVGQQFEVSTNATAWAALGGGSGWTDDGGTVRLTTAADDVAIGVATMLTSEKLRVVGNTVHQGDIYFEPTGFPRVGVINSAADTDGVRLLVIGGGAGAMAGATQRTGGTVLVQGGAGGSSATATDGGDGGIAEFNGGVGGQNTSTGDGGVGGKVEINGGESPAPTGTGARGTGGPVEIAGGAGLTGGNTYVRGGAGITQHGEVMIGDVWTKRVEIAGSPSVQTGFFGAAGVVQGTIGGAKLAGDVVMASLLTYLANLGLLVDNTT